MDPVVAAILPHYFSARAAGLPRIVRALTEMSTAPDQILIWNNTATALPLLPPEVIGIASPRNLGPQARLLAALLADPATTHYLFLDNDTLPDPELLANLLRWTSHFPVEVLTIEGRLAGRDLVYAHWPKRYGHDIPGPLRVTVSLARGELMPRAALLAVLARFPWGSPTLMDDLWVSACLADAGIPIYLVPTTKGVSHLGNLPRAEGLSTEPDYAAQRLQALTEILRRFPHWLTPDEVRYA